MSIPVRMPGGGGFEYPVSAILSPGSSNSDRAVANSLTLSSILLSLVPAASSLLLATEKNSLSHCACSVLISLISLLRLLLGNTLLALSEFCLSSFMSSSSHCSSNLLSSEECWAADTAFSLSLVLLSSPSPPTLSV